MADRGSPLGAAVGKATRRLLPFLLLLYVLAFLDRVNIGYAKQAFLADTGLSEAAYAFGAGVFFVPYALLAIPSNILLHRLGARIWLPGIMVVWGVISALTLLATGPHNFAALRFLLGAAESGFFPGVILYLTLWFPAGTRHRILGLFYFGAPLAQILGGPLSGMLLDMNGAAGLHGWQWMFLVEGVLAVLAGVWAYRYLTDRPAEAAWLSAPERAALQGELDAEDRRKAAPAGPSARPRRGRVIELGIVYGLIQLSTFGVIFYLPSEVGRLLHRQTGFIVSLVSSVPWLCALAAAYLVPRLAKQTGRRGAVGAAALVVAGAGIAWSSTSHPALGLTALCLAAAGFIGVQPLFWTIPADELSGVRAAGGIALINSLGSVGSFLAPNLRIWAETTWSSPLAGVLALAAATWLGALLFFRLAAAPRPIPPRADGAR
jgi:MFS family permease